MKERDSTSRWAGFWIRFIANLIDTGLLTVASWFLELMILGAVYWLGSHQKSFQDAFNPFMLQVFNGVLYLVLAFPYYTWGHYRYGTTLGKRPFRIYVVSMSDLLPITKKQAIVRTLSYVLSYLPFCAGFIMVAFQPEKRALHDFIAGTVSISKEKQGLGGERHVPDVYSPN
jgi:uncharacterized RDD family membrane protein YckC